MVLAQRLSIPSIGSPQNLAFQWLLSDPALFSNYSEDTIIQRFALATLFHSTDGRNWQNNEGWLTEADVCDWYTLTPSCDSGGIFRDLNLAFNQLSGVLPEQLGLLTGLHHLVMTGTGGSGRAIGGILPSSIGQMTQLKVLDVQANLLFGRIPPELGSLNNLEVLDLSMNSLNLSIPVELGSMTSLRELSLAMNDITGELPLSLNTLWKLERLSLGDNNISGKVEIGELPLLKILNLEKNQFTSISTQIGLLASLETLTLYENRLSGELLTDIGRLSTLQRLSIHSNQMDGAIPSEVGQMREMTDLNLSVNRLSGPIPSEIGLLVGLVRLELQSNRLEGPLPDSLGQLEQADIIRIDNNNISGEVSLDICNAFSKNVPLFYLDCADQPGGAELTCPNEFCCTYCCSDDTQECQCKHEGTFFDALCSVDDRFNE